MGSDSAPSLQDLPVSLARVDADHRIVWANRHFLDALGAREEELIGATCEQIGMDPSQAEAWSRALDSALESGAVSRFEYEGRVGDETRLLELRFVAEPGRASVLVVGFTNERAEDLGRQVFERDRPLSSFLDHAPVFAWLRDGTGRYQLVNRAYMNHYGLRPGDILGRTLEDRWPGPTGRAFAENDREVMASGRVREFTERAPDPDGTEHTFFNVKFPFVDAAGNPFVGGIGLDITDRIDCERKLANLERQSLAASLTSGAAHDLGNDLTAALQLAELARDEPDAVDDLLKVLERARERVAVLREAGGRRPEPTDRCELRDLVTQARAQLKVVLRSETLVEVRGDEADTEFWVVGITSQLQQVLENLLINADEAAAPDPARIRIGLGRRRHPPGLPPGVYVALSVKDEGPGIDEALLEHVFAPFRSTKGEGRGIGLAGAQAVVRAHGGRIGVRSAPGEGALFEVLLPAADPPDA